MGTNGNGQFRDEELVTRKMKVNGEWQTKIFPVVGGRLRLAHEGNENLSLQTELVSWDGNYAVFKCLATTDKGLFVGYGTANSQRDAKLGESLLELGETRSVARSLRFAGYGLEYCGAEEVSHVAGTEVEKEQSGSKAPAPVVSEGNGNSKREAQAPSGTAAETGSKPKSVGIDPNTSGATRALSGAMAETGSKPQPCGIGQATQAQCRALYALTKRANYQEADVGEMLAPFKVSRFEDLTRESASHLIGHLQQEVAA